MLRILNISEVTVDDFSVSATESVTSSNGDTETGQIRFEYKPKIELNVVDRDASIIEIYADGYGKFQNVNINICEIEKVDKTYKLKNTDNIVNDIKHERNIYAVNTYAIFDFEVKGDIILNSIYDVEYRCSSDSENQYLIPYYCISAESEKQEVDISIPAIKNYYMNY